MPKIIVTKKNIKLNTDYGTLKIYPTIENLTVTPSSIEQVFTHPNIYGYDTVTVEAVEADTLNITPTTQSQEHIGLYGTVNVDAVDSSIDNNIKAENIKQGINILGVTGNVKSATLITKTITGNKTYNAQDDNADGYSSVNVELFFKNDGVPYFKNMIFSNDVTSTTVLFTGCTYLETVKYEAGVTNLTNSLFRNCINLKEVELPNTLTTIQARAFQSCSSLSTINFPNSLTSISAGNQPFQSCTSLENVTIENGFNCNYLNLSSSTKYSVETMVSWFNALADRTGDTAYTFTIGATNLNKLTAEQKAIATNKNWTLA